jgi:hypothetical protein
MIAAITTWTNACRPPMPMPWKARAAISCSVFCASPLIIEPITKIVIATWTSVFLLNRSASLPQTGVVAVAVSSVAVTTHVYCVCVPFSEPMISGSAVATTVELIIATNSAMSRPDSDSSTCRCAIFASVRAARAAASGAVSVAASASVSVAASVAVPSCVAIPLGLRSTPVPPISSFPLRKLAQREEYSPG